MFFFLKKSATARSIRPTFWSCIFHFKVLLNGFKYWYYDKIMVIFFDTKNNEFYVENTEEKIHLICWKIPKNVVWYKAEKYFE